MGLEIVMVADREILKGRVSPDPGSAASGVNSDGLTNTFLVHTYGFFQKISMYCLLTSSKRAIIFGLTG